MLSRKSMETAILFYFLRSKYEKGKEEKKKEELDSSC